MPLRDALARVLSEYPRSKSAAFGGHPLAAYVRREAPQELEQALGAEGEGLLAVGSAGAGNWAEVPWLAVFDPLVTDSATRGYYVVYLFHAFGSVVHLSLNQGTTVVREEFAASARRVLADRSAFMRKRLEDYTSRLPIDEIELGSNGRLAGDYEAGHALGITYIAGSLPMELELQNDLQAAVRAYRALTFRGGLDTDVDGPDTAAAGDLVEGRRYRLHMRIERNPRAAKVAKSYHGTRCQACSMDFAERYGPLGSGFIEAHHLRPISTLEEGVPVRFDVAADFAVLCANCHRMIHRTEDPSDLEALRKLIRPALQS